MFSIQVQIGSVDSVDNAVAGLDQVHYASANEPPGNLQNQTHYAVTQS